MARVSFVELSRRKGIEERRKQKDAAHRAMIGRLCDATEELARAVMREGKTPGPETAKRKKNALKEAGLLVDEARRLLLR